MAVQSGGNGWQSFSKKVLSIKMGSVDIAQCEPERSKKFETMRADHISRASL